MRGKLLLGVMGLLVVSMGWLLTGCSDTESAASTTKRVEPVKLIVLSPHALPIRDAFAPRFSAWHEEHYGAPVTTRWIHKGTIEAHRHVVQLYGEGGDSPRPNDDGIDVFFGGGLSIHQDLAARGISHPVQLPEEIKNAIPAELNGQPLFAEDGTWYGTALNGLGILFNRKACEARGIPTPATWSDLTKPEYRFWVAAADPSRSGSTTACLSLAMMKHGWEEGWGVLMGILANTSGLLPNSSLIASNVSSSVAVAGLEPEFVARMAIAEDPESLEYVNPKSATVISPDPITRLKHAPSPKVADHFIEFVLSEEGQKLWPLGSEDGGPASKPLYRYPIRPDIYENYGDRFLIEGNPFQEPFDFQIDLKVQEAYTTLIPYLVKAACGTQHLLLQQAWAKGYADGPDSEAMMTLKTPLFDKEAALEYAAEISDSYERGRELEAAWADEFQKRYESILSVQTAMR
jgi:ABC-type Fe3+ transport system substrate-binding protein